MADIDPASGAEPKWRWRQFSIRTLLIAATIFALSAGACGHRVRTQQQAVATIKQLSGKVAYEPSLLGEWLYKTLPKSLTHRLGKDITSNIVSVELSRDVDISDDEFVAVIKAISRLPHASQLILYGNHRRRGDLQKLAPLQNQLKRLAIREWDRSNVIVDPGFWGKLEGNDPPKPNETLELSYLSPLTNLEELSIGGGSISEQALTDITSITSLHRLGLSECQFKGEHLQLLQRLPNLQQLWLHNSYVVASYQSHSKDASGKLQPNGKPHFDFERIYDSWQQSPSFPQDQYQQWLDKTLQDVEFHHWIMT